MKSADRQPANRYRPSLRTRAASLVLSLAICILIVIMLIKLGAGFQADSGAGSRLTAVSLSPTSTATPAAKTRATVKAAKAKPAVAPEVRPIQPRPLKLEKPVLPPNFLKLSREQFAAADISRMARPVRDDGGEAGTAQGGASASGPGQGPGAGAGQGPGEGPGGAKLHNAEWYREPTPAEMATYMPARRPNGGWATIACRTEERYHVGDCRELAESPPGSGLSRAMRQAAWQFLVRPPRINGRPVIGAWVRIRFDFSVKPANEEPGRAPG